MRNDVLVGSNIDAGFLGSRKVSIALFIACALFSALWALSYGEPKSWDTAHFHGYLGWAFLENRINVDLLAADLQSYQVPYAYIPFALMVKAGLAPIFTCALLGILQSLNLFFIYLILRSLLPGGSLYLIISGVVLSALSTVFLAGLGAPFADAIVTIPLLAAIYILLEGGRYSIPGAAVLAGLSVALKLTMAPFVVLFFILLAARAKGFKEWLINNVLFGAISLLTFFVLYLPWGMALYKQFGNPFFPLFNDFFSSPYFAAVAFHHDRFVPSTIAEHVRFPLEVALPSFMTYMEIVAPDVRYLTFILLFICGVIVALVKNRKGGGQKAPRVGMLFTLYVMSALFLWQFTSGNGRYGMLPLLLIGPASVLVANILFPARALATISYIILLQVFSLGAAGVPRWGDAEWSAEWYAVRSTSKNFKPALYLFDDRLKFASYYQNFPKGSVFVGVGGSFYPEPGSKMDDMVKARIERYKNLGVIGLKRSNYYVSLTELKREDLKAMFSSYSWLGYYPDLDSCFDIHIDKGANTTALFACNMLYDKTLRKDYIKGLNRVDDVFGYYEKKCPDIFTSTGAAMRMSNGWFKPYMFRDLMLYVFDDGEVMSKKWPAINSITQGSYKVSPGGAIEVMDGSDSCRI